MEYKILTDDAMMENPSLLSALNSALAMYDVAVLVVGSLNTGVHVLLTLCTFSYIVLIGIW